VTAQEAIEESKGLTFEKIWEMFQETDRKMKETDRELKEAGKMVKELSKNIGGVNNTLGEWTEVTVAEKLWEKINVFGYEFTKGGRNIKLWEGQTKQAEIDIFLENGDYAMPVEVKTRLKEADIDKHIERIQTIRRYLDKRNDKRRLVGAVAGSIVPESVREYAQQKGLYVLVPSGDSVAVAEAPQDFKAAEW
jgi:hypothetical protein